MRSSNSWQGCLVVHFLRFSKAEHGPVLDSMLEAGDEDEDAADDNDEKIYWTRAIGLIHL